MFLELTQRKPEIIDFQLALGKCYRKSKNSTLRRSYMKTLKKTFPASGEPYFEKGVLYLETEQYDDSVAELE